MFLKVSVRRRTPALAVAFVAACGVLVGCSGRPEAHSVKGRVTFKEDGKPAAAGGFVTLTSVSNPDHKAAGEIEGDGTFEMANSDGKGTDVFAGEYLVSVQPRMLDHDPAKSPIDPKYLDPQTSGLKVTVGPGTGELRIEVERNKRRPPARVGPD